MSQVTKDACKQNTKMLGGKYIMNGRKIDLLVEGNGLELSSNEWKNMVSITTAMRQQSKNIRINKAILSFWPSLNTTNSLTTLAME